MDGYRGVKTLKSSGHTGSKLQPDSTRQKNARNADRRQGRRPWDQFLRPRAPLRPQQTLRLPWKRRAHRQPEPPDPARRPPDPRSPEGGTAALPAAGGEVGLAWVKGALPLCWEWGGKNWAEGGSDSRSEDPARQH